MKYLVTVKDIWESKLSIEASSEEDARICASDGAGVIINRSAYTVIDVEQQSTLTCPNCQHSEAGESRLCGINKYLKFKFIAENAAQRREWYGSVYRVMGSFLYRGGYPMGRSQTIHCIGHAPTDDNTRRLYYAMNRLEIAQARHKAIKDNLRISYWTWQTKTGERILGEKADGFGVVLDRDVPTPKTITCPICEGDGHNGKYYCPVCAGSGITKRGNERKWRPEQLVEMRKEREEGRDG